MTDRVTAVSGKHGGTIGWEVDGGGAMFPTQDDAIAWADAHAIVERMSEGRDELTPPPPRSDDQETFEIIPHTWQALLPVMLTVLEYGETETARSTIREELKKMALAADRYNEIVKAREIEA